MVSAASLVEDATDGLLRHLRELGIDAHPASGHPSVRRLGSPLFGAEAHGFIDIDQSPIKWVDVSVWIGHASTPDEPREYLYARYGVPDDRLRTGRRRYTMSLTRRRAAPFLGEVTELVWRGNRAARGLVRVLTEDAHTRAVILAELSSLDRMAIRPNPVWINGTAPSEFWLIYTPYPLKIMHPALEVSELTSATWRCYEKLATTILGSPLPA